jgi:MYXO-CTERM domain-containing protein
VSAWVEPIGSPKHGITGDAARPILERSLHAWTDADCGSESPSIKVKSVELLTDEAAIDLGLTGAETDAGTGTEVKAGVNILRFLDDQWDYEGSHTIALTTITFGVQSGRIHNADIEVNSAENAITTSDAAVGVDLESILTHEAGHLFGLADVWIPGPTMYGFYGGLGGLEPRSLDSDDVEGICAIYPPGRFDDGGCTCSVPASHPPPLGTALLGLFLLLPLLRTKTRRRAQQRNDVEIRSPARQL